MSAALERQAAATSLVIHRRCSPAPRPLPRAAPTVTCRPPLSYVLYVSHVYGTVIGVCHLSHSHRDDLSSFVVSPLAGCTDSAWKAKLNLSTSSFPITTTSLLLERI